MNQEWRQLLEEPLLKSVKLGELGLFSKTNRQVQEKGMRNEQGGSTK